MTPEEKAKAYDEVVARINKAVSDGLVSENFGRDMLGIAESEDERTRKEMIEFLKSEKAFQTIDLSKSERWIAYLENQKEQKPAEWSEEDEQKLNWCINLVISQDSLSPEWKKEVLDWLKSLRPQPSRNLVASFMDYLDEHRPEGKMCLSNGECADIETALKENDWAKVIRYVNKYQPHWKPSKVQIEALKYMLGDGGVFDKDALKSLYNDLKKLYLWQNTLTQKN